MPVNAEEAVDNSQSNNLERFLTIDEIAAIMNVSRTTVSKLINTGDLPFTRVNKLVRVKESDLKSYLQKQEVRPHG